ncbi:hypothetical protein [Lapidilactobacillus bayanensis]|uniref:hypothetical protein n=1 Tax=Lapidilactobacillus bayanensis TaxID=2485998 RepID=UPI000F7B101C|nr:hypothetical protein [Lapidilactobacillus bayanensis]
MAETMVTLGTYPMPGLTFQQLNGNEIINNTSFIGGKTKLLYRFRNAEKDIIALDKVKAHTFHDFMLMTKQFKGIDLIFDDSLFCEIMSAALRLAQKIQSKEIQQQFALDVKSTQIIYNISASINSKSAMSIPAFHLHLNTLSKVERRLMAVSSVSLSEIDTTVSDYCLAFQTNFQGPSISIFDSLRLNLAGGVNIRTEWQHFGDVNVTQLVTILQKVDLAMESTLLSSDSEKIVKNYSVALYVKDVVYILVRPRMGTSIGGAAEMFWPGQVNFARPIRNSGTMTNEMLDRRRKFQSMVLTDN